MIPILSYLVRANKSVCLEGQIINISMNLEMLQDVFLSEKNQRRSILLGFGFCYCFNVKAIYQIELDLPALLTKCEGIWRYTPCHCNQDSVTRLAVHTAKCC